jgi:hypothetical protein
MQTAYILLMHSFTIFKDSSFVLDVACLAASVLQVLAALPLVLQHWQPPRHRDRDATKLLCTLLQVSQSVSSALQQSGCRCSVSLSKPSSRQATSFAAWLQRYGSFLHSFTASDSAAEGADTVLEYMFSMGLQLYCAGARRTLASTSAQTAAGGWQLAMPARRQVPLRLESLGWAYMQSPAVLQTLQAAPSFTELKLTGVSTAHVTPAMLAALGVLTGLRSLTVDCIGSEPLPQQFMSVVGGMQQLTCLSVSCLAPEPDSMLLLPTSLWALTCLVVSQPDAAADDEQQQQRSLSFAHMKNLLELKVGVVAGKPAAVLLRLVLPPDLTCLTTGNHVDVVELPVGISEMHLFNGHQCLGLVRKLPSLQAVSKFVLYCTHEPSIPLPESRALFRSELMPVFATLGCLTTLTCVEFENHIVPSALFLKLPMGQALGQLRQLVKFSCFDMSFSEQDVMHLSSLTNLTQLHLQGAGRKLSDLVACTIAANCPRLQRLSFAFAGIKTQAIFGVVAKLMDMEQFNIVGNDVAVTELGLFQLTSLKKLTDLGLPEGHQVAQDFVDRFLHVMPQLTYLNFD